MLATKLYIPQPLAGVVARPAVAQQLDQSLFMQADARHRADLRTTALAEAEQLAHVHDLPVSRARRAAGAEGRSRRMRAAGVTAAQIGGPRLSG